MLSFAPGNLLMALIAGVVGFGGRDSAATNVAMVMFYTFLGLFVLSLVGTVLGERLRLSLVKLDA